MEYPEYWIEPDEPLTEEEQRRFEAKVREREKQEAELRAAGFVPLDPPIALSPRVTPVFSVSVVSVTID